MVVFNMVMAYVEECADGGTTEKNKTIEKYLKQQYEQDYKEYIGIASDEIKRIKKERTKHKLLPLVDWRNGRKRLLRILLF